MKLAVYERSVFRNCFKLLFLNLFPQKGLLILLCFLLFLSIPVRVLMFKTIHLKPSRNTNLHAINMRICFLELCIFSPGGWYSLCHIKGTFGGWCINCFLLLVYTINLSLSTDLVDSPPIRTFYMKHTL